MEQKINVFCDACGANLCFEELCDVIGCKNQKTMDNPLEVCGATKTMMVEWYRDDEEESGGGERRR